MDARLHWQLLLALTYSPLILDSLEEDRDEDRSVPQSLTLPLRPTGYVGTEGRILLGFFTLLEYFW